MTERVAIGKELAEEAQRYLDVVAGFAALGADPHAEARDRAASERSRELKLPRTRALPRRRRLRR
jgi:hypothetical protein